MYEFFRVCDKAGVLKRTDIRKFETRIGERIQIPSIPNNIRQSLEAAAAPYVIFGIPEDIGVKANGGMGGASTAWESFLAAFLNIQSNAFLDGSEMLLLGNFDFSMLSYAIETNARNKNEMLSGFRHAVDIIDDAVEQLAKDICAAGKIPVVIGGGHNNAYPLIKGSAKGLKHSGKIPSAKINVINLDAHADYRPMEGRHSGNPFRYAEADGFLDKYAVIGLHQNYLGQGVLDDLMGNININFTFFEHIFLDEKMNFTQAVAEAAGFTENNFTGVELDMDCIENVLSSAATPSGISMLNAREYLHFTALHTKPAYLHLCEAVAERQDSQKDGLCGKRLTYLATGFIKAHQEGQRPARNVFK